MNIDDEIKRTHWILSMVKNKRFQVRNDRKKLNSRIKKIKHQTLVKGNMKLKTKAWFKFVKHLASCDKGWNQGFMIFAHHYGIMKLPQNMGDIMK